MAVALLLISMVLLTVLNLVTPKEISPPIQKVILKLRTKKRRLGNSAMEPILDTAGAYTLTVSHWKSNGGMIYGGQTVGIAKIKY